MSFIFANLFFSNHSTKSMMQEFFVSSGQVSMSDSPAATVRLLQLGNMCGGPQPASSGSCNGQTI